LSRSDNAEHDGGGDLRATSSATDARPGEELAREAAQLATAVLDAEQERQARQASAHEQVLFADDLLPGVGAHVPFRDALRRGGVAVFVVLLLLTSLDELESAALAVLAPDIRDAFGVGNGVIVFLAAASGGFLILGALPMGWLADRYPRPRIVGWASLAFAGFVAASGLAVNAFQLFLARLGAGVAKSSTLPVHGSLIADTYPIGARGRLSAAMAMGGRLAATLSPVVVAGIAALVGGVNGWRWPYYMLGIPVAVLGLVAFRLREPPRGQFEKRDVLGDVIEDKTPAPVSMEAAFARLWQIRTMKSVVVAFAAVGFGLFTFQVLANLFMEDEYGTPTLARGVLGTIGGIAVLCVLPFAGSWYDRLYRRDPARALKLVGMMILPAAILTPAQFFAPNVVAFTILGIPQLVLLTVAFTMVSPVMQSIVPYRLRGLGVALGSIYIFLVGATGGALVSALLAEAFGPRVAVLAVIVPSTIIGGLLIMRSARFIRNDLSLVVAELRNEMAEHERQRSDPGGVPALQLADVDYSYGPIQVLFDVNLEVRRGEVLALVGTNGAGKSTILRVVAGLGTPARGVVRLNGRTITYTTPEQRVRMGIRTLLGGKGLFPAMTVHENLEMAAFVYRGDDRDFRSRLARAYELFPTLAGRRSDLASTLSGGQQQILALAMTLLHDPEVLAIDELSLGLAPVLVQELLAVIDRLKAGGMTIILVEQSLNVALSVADRAMFLEKGQVRFSGPAGDLAERGDLARAVFLGTDED
jgi:ABC-type branched-subunit amino acid transport system ATPase component/predicted MFS family arabinose efflux permease